MRSHCCGQGSIHCKWGGTCKIFQVYYFEQFLVTVNEQGVAIYVCVEQPASNSLSVFKDFVLVIFFKAKASGWLSKRVWCLPVLCLVCCSCSRPVVLQWP